MTPKEKAAQLVEKFIKYCRNLKTKQAMIKSAKQCALIAVDEILLAIDWHEYEYPNEQFEYWHKVRTEIENL